MPPRPVQLLAASCPLHRSEEKQRKITESSLAATSEILKEVKTVRQFAQEPEETANYRRGELARHTFVEAEYVTKRTHSGGGLCLPLN